MENIYRKAVYFLWYFIYSDDNRCDIATFAFWYDNNGPKLSSKNPTKPISIIQRAMDVSLFRY